MTDYNYTMPALAIDRLTQEIGQSTIVTALDHVTALGTSVDIFFKTDLSSSDKASLDSIVAAHSGQPLPSGPQPVALSGPISVASTPAFASKNFGTKALFKRVVGQQYALTIGDNTLLYTETFPWVKFMSLEILNGEFGDYVSLYILDTSTGKLTGVPNYQLNQFGFSCNIAPGFYQHRSEFDADIYQGLQIKIVYHSVSAKTIGVNYVMNEVK